MQIDTLNTRQFIPDFIIHGPRYSQIVNAKVVWPCDVRMIEDLLKTAIIQQVNFTIGISNILICTTSGTIVTLELAWPVHMYSQVVGGIYVTL